jgi:hypothetical protein
MTDLPSEPQKSEMPSKKRKAAGRGGVRDGSIALAHGISWEYQLQIVRAAVYFRVKSSTADFAVRKGILQGERS